MPHKRVPHKSPDLKQALIWWKSLSEGEKHLALERAGTEDLQCAWAWHEQRRGLEDTGPAP